MVSVVLSRLRLSSLLSMEFPTSSSWRPWRLTTCTAWPRHSVCPIRKHCPCLLTNWRLAALRYASLRLSLLSSHLSRIATTALQVVVNNIFNKIKEKRVPASPAPAPVSVPAQGAKDNIASTVYQVRTHNMHTAHTS